MGRMVDRKSNPLSPFALIRGYNPRVKWKCESQRNVSRFLRNRLALWEMSGQPAQHQGGLAELVDALDSKSSSNECGFESHSRYFSSLR
jgi:hypothetical protein